MRTTASHTAGDAKKQLRIPKRELRRFAEITMLLRLNAGKNQQRGEIHGDDERRHGDGENRKRGASFYGGSCPAARKNPCENR